MHRLFPLALMGLSSLAFAASPHPTAQDADGDGYWVATIDVNGDSVKGVKDIGVKAIDCDDRHKSVNPGATDIVNDGIDQDCDGNDADRDGAAELPLHLFVALRPQRSLRSQ